MGRLTAQLLPIRSLWFPTPRELRAWQHSGLPLYLRPLSATSIEVGPRLHSMWASCFSPVWRASLHPEGASTRLTWSRTVPRFTLGLLAMWWVAVVAWLVSLVPDLLSGAEHPAWLVFWTLLALASTAGPLVGWVLGGRALDAALPALGEALQHHPVDEDW